jgi:putative addiction module killer protein
MSLIKIVFYTSVSGKRPFLDWIKELDLKIKSIVLARIDRITLSNFGDCKPIKGGDGVYELRIDHGAGYRIYFGKRGATLVVLLLGGDKGSQDRDIAKAKRYWAAYKESLDD